MATTYNHIRMSEVDASANVRVMYPETTAADVTVSRTNNSNIPSTVTTMQLLADKLAASAFTLPIDDSSTTSTTKSWSAKKINTAVTNISTYVGTDGKLHFKNSAGTDSTLAFNKASGTAAAAQVLTGYTFSNDSGTGLTGAMANKGAWTPTNINPGGSIAIPAGYHNGSGKVTANANQNSGTYTPTTRAASIDMGANNSYRYVTTTSVPNSNTATYTTTTREKKDLGATNNYRYVDTSGMSNVNSGTYTPTTRAANIDMGAANSYRYLTTTSVPNDNSTTYTPTTRAANIDMGQTNTHRYVTTTSVPNSCTATYTLASSETTKDLGATNNYRWVNATNVYTKGKNDGATTHSQTYELKWDTDFGKTNPGIDMGETHNYRYISVPAKPKIKAVANLYANYSPTNNFTGQTLTMNYDFDLYKYLQFVYYANTSTSNTNSLEIIIETDFFLYTSDSASTTMLGLVGKMTSSHVVRWVYHSPNESRKLYISDCYSSGGDNTKHNNYLIPYTIWGCN